MGLDFVLWDKDDQEIGFTEISEKLHETIFRGSYRGQIGQYLRNLYDYYLTYVTFKGKEIQLLIFDLENMKSILNDPYKQELERLIVTLSDNRVFRVYIAGD
ncbi:hypothetical protein [Peribacillus loiseleuriae]|uniref:hypothetical protein n=1 Tax=Peribacillus loiseleuriae TaxID=1679170 RepID=UPI003D057411